MALPFCLVLLLCLRSGVPHCDWAGGDSFPLPLEGTARTPPPQGVAELFVCLFSPYRDSKKKKVGKMGTLFRLCRSVSCVYYFGVAEPKKKGII